MFGLIALIVIQTAINAGLILKIRRTGREMYEIWSTIDHVVSKVSENREAIDKLTYKP